MDWGAYAGDMGMGALSAWYNNRSALHRQHEAQDFEKEMYQHRYQYQVQDLMAAGLNPMLAYLQSPGSAPSMSPASAQGADLGNLSVSSKLASAQEGKLHQDTIKGVEETKFVSANTKKTEAETLVALGMPAVLASQVLNNTSSAAQADAARKKILAEIPKVEQEINTLKTQAQKNKSDVKLNEALTEGQVFLNGLRMAEAYLMNQKAEITRMESVILKPKEQASKTWAAEQAASTANWGEIGSNTWKMFNPFKNTHTR